MSPGKPHLYVRLLIRDRLSPGLRKAAAMLRCLEDERLRISLGRRTLPW